MFELASLARPVVCAPMAGGPSTPELVSAVHHAGGVGFLAAGYRTVRDLAAQFDVVRAAGARAGVNLFWIEPNQPDGPALAAYLARLRAEADPFPLGHPHWEDDERAAKVAWCLEARPEVVSFTFGCPTARLLAEFADAEILTMVTVTTRAEAQEALARGAGSLCVQGPEAGGHRGTWDPLAEPSSAPLPALLRDVVQVARPQGVPVVAGGGISDAAGVRAVVEAGAVAAQVGTAFLLADEAGTSAAHRRGLTEGHFARTATTRAFTGRWARGLENAFIRDHPEAPAAYPQIHHVTASWRRQAAAEGNLDALHLWAGTGFARAESAGAATIVEHLAAGIA